MAIYFLNLKKILCFSFLFFLAILVIMANIISDVDYLRQQYETGKSQANQLIVKYNNQQFQDGDVLQKSATQITPQVQFHIETDPQQPYFTLIMADPDAPQRGNERAGPWLHWIQAAFQGNDVTKGKTLGTIFFVI